MNKFAVNYQELEIKLADKPQVFKLADVKDKIRVVAFDVVKFHDSDGLDGLWQIKQTEEGEYIVATYDDSELTSEASVQTPWNALEQNGLVHIFYKNDPVTKISLASVGIPAEEAYLFVSHLPKSLAANKKLAASMLKELSDEERKELFASHPELQV
jgi:hypothetical protein